jgi:hypothetical protein
MARNNRSLNRIAAVSNRSRIESQPYRITTVSNHNRIESQNRIGAATVMERSGGPTQHPVEAPSPPVPHYRALESNSKIVSSTV